MQHNLVTRYEVEARIASGASVMLPIGSAEQHSLIGLIETDTICANDVSIAATNICGGIAAPPIGHTRASFNAAFPGTVSIAP